MRKPNILWFCSDQQRWDTIGALGNAYAQTPTLDGLAREGVAFARAFCQSPICTPSRATFLTGRYPAAHRVQRNGNAYFPPGERLVTKLFAEAGYDCGLIGKLHLSASHHLEQRPDDGYRTFLWSHHPTPDYPSGHAYADWLAQEKKVDPVELYAKVSGFVGPGIPTEYHQTTWCAEMAERFIRERRGGDTPWLLSVNPFDPHPPFDPPAEYLARFDPDILPPPRFEPGDLVRQQAFAGVDQQAMVARDPTQRMAVKPADVAAREALAYTAPDTLDGRLIKAAYYAMISLIDDALARVLAALRDTGQLDDTIVVFHSDHGELLGDHGLILKGCRFFDGLVRVPLMFRWPRRFAAGVASEALVELVDLAPTLLDSAGLAVPPYMQGRSLVPLLSGKADPHQHKQVVVAEYNDALALPNASHGTMSFDGRYKTIVYHGTGLGEIYDHAHDPGEFDNQWGRDDGLQSALITHHLDALAATIDPGPHRVAKY
ncbi:MAG: sulfatase-like hydrolase/transferase [Alphaproteobacteria bacterium]|nr:sulfatase-like hydrolase/transferase [Alphaproteobacteria bacterium]